MPHQTPLVQRQVAAPVGGGCPIRTLGVDPIWLGVMICVNLQTSFLTPPFGFSLFYLRSVAPDDLPTGAIYRGAVPFVLMQLGILLLALQPGLATTLPQLLG